jgi:hypothetical protein
MAGVRLYSESGRNGMFCACVSRRRSRVCAEACLLFVGSVCAFSMGDLDGRSCGFLTSRGGRKAPLYSQETDLLSEQAEES